jgi:hypothetical protein
MQGANVRFDFQSEEGTNSSWIQWQARCKRVSHKTGLIGPNRLSRGRSTAVSISHSAD